MAERKFDYENVGAVYKNMQNITGDESNSDSIAGILHQIDEEVHNKVDVCEEAIYGDLGKQLLLDWDNTSSNFPNFVTNFSNWSTLIAQSAGNYSQFEQDIKGFKEANPLGATSGGITDAYTNTGFYRTYSNENKESFLNSSSNLRELNNVDLSGIEYEFTDSQAILTRHKVITGVMLAGDVASALLIAAWASGGITASSTSTALVPTGGGPAGSSLTTGATGTSSAAGATGTSSAAGATGAGASTNYSSLEAIREALHNGAFSTKAAAKAAVTSLYPNGIPDGSAAHALLAEICNLF